MPPTRLHRRGILRVAPVLFAVVVTGCGASDKASVKGKVIHDGQPVSGGSITFAPIASADKAGKPATGKVQSDGSFVLGTEEASDGALIGRHNVVYRPPAAASENADPNVRSPYHGLVPKESEVEVKAGQNEVSIELVRKP
jgi:hypothetical protein